MKTTTYFVCALGGNYKEPHYYAYNKDSQTYVFVTDVAQAEPYTLEEALTIFKKLKMLVPPPVDYSVCLACIEVKDLSLEVVTLAKARLDDAKAKVAELEAQYQLQLDKLKLASTSDKETTAVNESPTIWLNGIECLKVPEVEVGKCTGCVFSGLRREDAVVSCTVPDTHYSRTGMFVDCKGTIFKKK